MATYRDGQVFLDEPVIWPNGTRLVVLPDSKDVCADGTPWPETNEEIAAWLARWENLEPLDLTQDELRQLDEQYVRMREEQKLLMQREWEKLEKLF